MLLRKIKNKLIYSWRLFRQALSSAENDDFTRMPIRRALVLLAIPMMAEMAMESIFAVVDIFFVARIGPEAVAAVGLTEAMLTILIAVAVGVAMATTAMVARRTGESDPEGAARATGQALWLGLIIAGTLGVAGSVYSEQMLAVMGADEAVIETGNGYTRVLFGGSLTLMYLFLINAAFRGAGNAAIAMRVLWVANGINIVLDPLFIFGIGPFPELGVTGAAVATTIGRGVGACLGLWWLYKGNARLRLQKRHFAPNWAVMSRLARLSAGGVSQFLIATSSWMLLMSLVARFGSEAVAGYTICRSHHHVHHPAGMGVGQRRSHAGWPASGRRETLARREIGVGGMSLQFLFPGGRRGAVYHRCPDAGGAVLRSATGSRARRAGIANHRVRLRTLRHRHGSGSVPEWGRRYRHPDVDQSRVLLAVSDTAGLVAGHGNRARCQRHLLGGHNRRVPAGCCDSGGISAGTVEAQNRVSPP